jgi:Flp pilus assembly pilin Flp
MRRTAAVLKAFWRDENGQDMIEYALLVGVIALSIAFMFPSAVSPSISTIFSKVSANLNAS